MKRPLLISILVSTFAVGAFAENAVNLDCQVNSDTGRQGVRIILDGDAINLKLSVMDREDRLVESANLRNVTNIDSIQGPSTFEGSVGRKKVELDLYKKDYTHMFYGLVTSSVFTDLTGSRANTFTCYGKNNRFY